MAARSTGAAGAGVNEIPDRPAEARDTDLSCPGSARIALPLTAARTSVHPSLTGGSQLSHGLVVTGDDDRPAGFRLGDRRREASLKVLN